MEELIKPFVPVVAVIVGAILTAVLAHANGKANRAATEKTEAAAWQRAQEAETSAWQRAREAERAGWLREERTKVHFKFIESLAEITQVSVSNPKPGPVLEWEQEYHDKMTAAQSQLSRMLDRMKLLCEFPTYLRAVDFMMAHQAHVGPAAASPRRFMGPEEEAAFQARVLQIAQLEKIYMDAVRTELSVTLEDTRATVFD
ncbi:hypothetical protein QEH68_06820 [Paenarthrobacter sp. OM7]|uniref:hypothetical protein n=1 Tax=Paenarthrobacter sp. OM7 TaxID=3041264 RepID=UPI0024684E51|nr:hypothetical protein [Paenarthrobacter sp. OM7]WGM21881.1 hypothetical protein QEH68_06820 [Paenarthrobacter sp. OM7]